MVQARLTGEIAQMRDCGLQYWPVSLLEDGSHVGCAGLRPYRVQDGIYEFGVHLRGAFQGKGLAREAAEAVIAYGFGTIGAGALFAGHHPRNERSRRLLLGLGFAYAQEEFYAPTGLMHPSYLLRGTPREQATAKEEADLRCAKDDKLLRGNDSQSINDGCFGGWAKLTRMKLMIIKRSQLPNLLKCTRCQPFCWFG
jgi:ribosomal-protein-alanine N-acetyltransferase